MILVLTLMIFKWIDVLVLRTNEGNTERKGEDSLMLFVLNITKS